MDNIIKHEDGSESVLIKDKKGNERILKRFDVMFVESHLLQTVWYNNKEALEDYYKNNPDSHGNYHTVKVKLYKARKKAPLKKHNGILRFGKYTGQPIHSIVLKDKGYLEFLYNSYKRCTHKKDTKIAKGLFIAIAEILGKKAKAPLLGN